MKAFKSNLLSNWLLLFPIYLISMTTIFTIGSSLPMLPGDTRLRLLTPTLEETTPGDSDAQLHGAYRSMRLLLPVTGLGSTVDGQGNMTSRSMADPAVILLIGAGAIGLAGIGRRRRSPNDKLTCECSE